jgi:hypothetical protein
MSHLFILIVVIVVFVLPHSFMPLVVVIRFQLMLIVVVVVRIVFHHISVNKYKGQKQQVLDVVLLLVNVVMNMTSVIAI